MTRSIASPLVAVRSCRSRIRWQGEVLRASICRWVRGDWSWKRPGEHEPPFDLGCVGTAFRRVALKNLTTGDTQGRFFRTSTAYFHPRWSFDGTRIAYVSDPNTPFDRDILLGLPTFNHPPTFNTSLPDRQATEGSTIAFDIAATDPDVDPISYEMALAPATANLLGSVFSWTNVGPPGDYYVVYRAMDDAGAAWPTRSSNSR